MISWTPGANASGSCSAAGATFHTRGYFADRAAGCSDRAFAGEMSRRCGDLGDADVGVGPHRLGGLNVVVSEFWRTTSGTARAPGGGEARLGALPDQAALEFRQRTNM